MQPVCSLRRVSLLLLALLVARGTTTRAAAQDRSAALLVTVVAEDSGRPLAGATVIVQGTTLHAITDASGRARLTSVGTGQQTVEARYLGYHAARATLSLSGGVRETVLQLAPAPVRLAEVEVRAATRPTQLEANGFVRRQRGGNGTFITRADIERQRPRHLSDLLRRLPGISMGRPNAAGQSRTAMRGSAARNCQPQVFVDGVQTSVFYIDDVMPGSVEGMEIYRGAASIPAQYNRGMALCGVVLIWTREK